MSWTNLNKIYLLSSLLLFSQVHADTYTVTNSNDSGSGSLRSGIEAVNSSPSTYTAIDCSGISSQTITLVSSLPVISASTLAISGNDVTINGASLYQAFFVNSGTVTISDFTLDSTAAVGGSGGSNPTNTWQGGGSGGGGGLGAGGGIFVNDNANVTATNVSFTSNLAEGGAGGTGGSFSPGVAGGGGAGGGSMRADGGIGGNPDAADGDAGGGGGGGGGYAAGSNGGDGVLSPYHGGAGGTGGQGADGTGGGAGGAGGTGVLGDLDGHAGTAGSATSVFCGGGGAGGGTAYGSSKGDGGIGANGDEFAGGSGGGGGSGYPGASGQPGNGESGGSGGFGGGGGGSGISNQGGACGGYGGFGSGGGGCGGDGGGTSEYGGGSGGPGHSGGFVDGAGGGGAGFGGAVFVRNGGTLNLAGAVTFSGNTTTAGLAPTGSLGGDGSAAGNDIFFMSGGNLNFELTSALTISSIIAGGDGLHSGGGLVQEGPSTLTLTGVNTYSGGTTINGGILNISSDSCLGDSLGTIAFGGGTLQASDDITSSRSVSLSSSGIVDTNGNNMTISGVVSGSGSFEKQGSGILTVSGSNSYSGATTITEGTIAMSGGGTLSSSSSVAVGTGTTFDISAVTSSSTVKALSGAGSVSLGTKGLVLNQSSDATFSGAISGTGTLTKNGSSQSNFSGTNTFSGDSSVNAGVLNVTSSGSFTASALTVGQNGVLSGSGSVYNVTNNGTVRPGSSIGTLTIPGDYVHGSAATLEIEFNDAGSCDLLNITGTATINGGTLKLQPYLGGYNAMTCTLLQSTGGVTGTFDTVTVENSARLGGLSVGINYGANSISFSLTGASHGVIKDNKVLISLHSELAKRIMDTQEDNFSFINSLMSCEMNPCFSFINNRDKLRIIPYANIVTTGADIRETANNESGKYFIYGPVLGINFVKDWFLMGAGVDYFAGKIKDKKNRGEVKSHTLGGSVYTQMIPWSFLSTTLTANFSWTDYNTNHTVTTGNVAKASTDGWQGGAEIFINPYYCYERRILLKGIIKGRYDYYQVDSYKEKEGAQNLHVGKDSFNYWETELGLSWAPIFKTNSVKYILQLSVSEVIQLGNTNRHVMIHLLDTSMDYLAAIDGFRNHYTKIEGFCEAIIKDNASLFIEALTTVDNRDVNMFAVRGGLSFSF